MGTSTPTPAPAQQQMSNGQIRALILQTAVEMKQQIFSQSINPASQSVVIVPFVNVGLIKGFLVKIEGTIHNAGSTNALARTQYGAANLVNQFQLTDYQNQVRINTSGWHVTQVANAKQDTVFGGAYSPNAPYNYGMNFPIMLCPSTLATGADATISMYFWVPCSYSKVDLTGSIFAQLVNATAQLQISLNTVPGANTTGDPTLAVYSSATGAADAVWKTGTTIKVTVFQYYLDQLPYTKQGQPVLPPQDVNTIYELKNVAMSALVQGQDFNIPFANFRTFMSASVIYDNAGVLNNGSDINYWALRAANTQQIFQVTPNEVALWARTTFDSDLPLGVYHFEFRDRPINTQQFGNMNLVINPAAVTNGASLLVGFEDFAQVSQVQYYGSLPAN